MRRRPELLMLRRRFLASCAAAILVLVSGTGCAVHEAARNDVTQAIEQWQRQRVHVGENLVQQNDVSRAPDPDAVPPPLTEDASEPAASTSPLQGYIAEALQRNPSIKAAIADVRAKLERIAQVTSLSDPVLKAIIRPEPIQTAAGDVVFTLGMAQKIPLPEKLDRKGHIAAAEVRMAIAQLNTTRLRVIADVERAFYRMYLAERSLELTRENLEVLQTLQQVVESQYRVGRVGQPDVLRVHTEVSNLLNDEDVFQRQRSAAAAALNQLQDCPVTDTVATTNTIELRTVCDRIEDLLALAREHNPEVAALVHQMERDQQGVKLADLGYWPNLTAGFEWSHVDGRRPFVPPRTAAGVQPPFNRASEQGDDNWALTFQVNLPIWPQRIEAARREAREKLERSRQARHAAENLTAFRVYDAWVRTQTRQDTVQLLKSTIIPQAAQTYDVSITAYEVGETDFLTLIDNWRIMLEFELMLHRETAGLETAFAELQREVGLQIVRDRIAAARRSEREKS